VKQCATIKRRTGNKRDGTQITLHFATPELAKLFKDSMTAMGNKRCLVYY